MHKKIRKANGYKKPIQIIINMQELRNGIGQSLLNQNYASVNYRYRENTKAPKYNYEDVEVNERIIVGCINCYIYQSCETDGFDRSALLASLSSLKMAILKRLISEKGQEIPWGYEK